ncbi:hypothetical protein KLP40_12095 [Hymenobacter sp. NST-14]|uniref:hypothetical protein n=1 Tax=Hymenobacter piscis TaxID=2839984 RepID=UPI001C01ADF0|nr:hypothetical protein [Hymenobacter piscis]MBT9393905.1 hypothetical protein [Hymenobacter piscis]
MKKLILLAALVCGASFSSMAADYEKNRGVQAPLFAVSTNFSGVNIPEESESNSYFLPFEYDCKLVTLSCGRSGYVCGETGREIELQKALDDILICGCGCG